MKSPTETHDRRRTFTDEKEKEIFDFWLGTGHTEPFLAKKYGCKQSVINSVLNRFLAKRKKAYEKGYGRDKEAGTK